MILYDISFLLFSIVYLPYLAFKSKAHKDFVQRFGFLPKNFCDIGNSRPIWIHAVSVGEVLAAKPLIQKISSTYDSKKIVLSTTTRTGNEIANRVIDGEILKFYFPVDLSGVIRKVVDIINPSILVVIETEIWPNLISELYRRRIPVALVNGRISDRSFNGYRLIKPVFRNILGKISIFCMQTELDAERIIHLGAVRENVKVSGNVKFDAVFPAGKTPEEAKEIFGVKRVRFIIAGSTHKGEEDIILDIYRRILTKVRDISLIIAPRHIERAKEIGRLIQGKGFKPRYFSESDLPGACGEVTVLDRLGVLPKIYRYAEIVFIGGSLVKRGGHNIIEPAFYGKPILFGSFMFNFRDITKLFLKNNAAIMVKDSEQLEAVIKELLLDSKKREELGNRAKWVVYSQRGAVERIVLELDRFI